MFGGSNVFFGNVLCEWVLGKWDAQRLGVSGCRVVVRVGLVKV